MMVENLKLGGIHWDCFYLNKYNSRDDIKLIGKNKIEGKNRAPTISFTFNNISSKEISKKLVTNGIATRNDNFYAWRCLEALGIDFKDGVIVGGASALLAASVFHYNEYSISDVKEYLKNENIEVRL